MSPRAAAWFGGACVVLLVHAGCATAPRPRADAAPDGRAVAEAECRISALRAAQIGDVREAFGSGLALTTYLVLRGAGEGVWWGIVTGGHRGGDGAWIGAAVGAGIGALVGLGVGISQGADAHERYRAAYASCLVAR